MKPNRHFDRLSIELNDFLKHMPHLSGDLEVYSDMFGAGSVQMQTPGQAGKVFLGRVLYSLPFFGSYHVLLENGEVRPCVLSCGQSGTVFGTSVVSGMPPDTPVVVYVPSKSFKGYIVNALPNIIFSQSNGLNDWVVQGSRAGVRHSDYYKDMIKKTADAGGFQNYSHRKPNDTLVTDYTQLTTLGNGLHIDPFYMFFRVDESCGIFAYTVDQMLRIAGANLEEWSDQHSVERKNVNSELMYYLGESVYPWEAIGSLSPTQEWYSETPDKDVLYDKPLGKLEPADPNQQSFCRYEEYGGYLGQGRIRQVSIPKSLDGINKLDGATAKGVFRETIGLDGTYTVNSGKSITFARRSRIVIPKRRKLPTDISDDSNSAEDYKSSGMYGSGSDHAVKEITYKDSEKSLSAAAQAMDCMALEEWRSLSTFNYRDKDFELEDSDEKLVTVPEYSQLTARQFLPDPKESTSDVDHRYTDARLLELLSFIRLDDSGNIVIQSGCGSSIKFVNGAIHIDAPAGVSMSSGKNINMLAGDDAIVRAKNSVDISASDKDLRLKAKNNLQVLANTGGILLESKSSGDTHVYPVDGGEAVQSSGIVFKAAKSTVASVAGAIYLRTGSSDGGISSGDIVIDADKGRANIRTRSSQFIRHISNTAKDAFGLSTPTTTNEFGPNTTRFGTGLDVNGPVLGASYAEFAGQVVSVRGHMQSASGGLVGKLRDPASRESIIRIRTSTANSNSIALLQSEYQTGIVALYEQSGKIGNGLTQSKIGFSYRSDADYGTLSNFTMQEPNWQYLARATNQNLPVWSEDVVTYQNQPQMPWPGRRNWTSDTLLCGAPTLVDILAGKPADKEAMEAAELPALTKRTPQQTFMVIGQ